MIKNLKNEKHRRSQEIVNKLRQAVIFTAQIFRVFSNPFVFSMRCKK